MIAALANSLWLAGCVPELVRFHRATARVESEQWSVLRRILAANRHSAFGRQHDFDSIRSVAGFQQRVPIHQYEELERAIETKALTSEPVRFLQPTSGSSGRSKRIPYTASLQREFQRGIRAWIADLFLHDPKLMNGQAYWSVSPGGAASGFDDDSAYVGGWQQRLVESVMAVPSTVRHLSDMEAFRYATLRHLLRAPSLRIISVWNPTFLTLLTDRLPEFGERLARDLDSGRASVVRAALRASTAAERHTILWPDLGLISCWSDANAAGPAAQLRSQFPHARLQGKGLIATEGFVSFPLSGREESALAVRSHFFEFLSEGGSVHLAHQLERGRRYTVVLTNGGGLYRYRLNDEVEVIGHVHDCPTLRFVGRGEYVSDWFGEKLHEAFVSRILSDACQALAVFPDLAMIACDTDIRAYVLYIDAHSSDATIDQLALRVESQLRTSFHYDYARRLGQLAPLRVVRTDNGAETWLAVALSEGQRAGDVKPRALDRRDGWSQRFPGVKVPTPRAGRFPDAAARASPSPVRREVEPRGHRPEAPS